MNDAALRCFIRGQFRAVLDAFGVARLIGFHQVLEGSGSAIQLNGFGSWNRVIPALMVTSFAYPIIQFLLLSAHNPSAWGY